MPGERAMFSKLMVVSALLMGPIMLAQSRRQLVEDMGYADTILVNGKIVSMDDRSITPDTPGHIYTAMAIKGKMIMALGNDADIVELAGPATKTVDLGRKTVIPGIILTHYHTYTYAVARYGQQF